MARAKELSKVRLLSLWAWLGLGLLGFVSMLLAVEFAWPPLRKLDDTAAASFGQFGRSHAWWTPLWVIVSDVFSPLAFRVYTVVALAVLIYRRRRDRGTLTLLVVGVLGGGLLPVLIKEFIDRPRPPEMLVPAFQSSFPSSHAFGVVVATMTLALLLDPRHARRFAPLGLALVITVCFARVGLAVHYVSDVIAGASLGLAWSCAVGLWTRALEAKGQASANGDTGSGEGT